jgi:hypothetical protein
MITLDFFSFLVVALAGLRLAYMLTVEAMPFNIGTTLRARFPVGGLTSCIKCASIWTSALMLGLWYLDGAFYVIVYVFAISGAGLVIRSFSGFGLND